MVAMYEDSLAGIAVCYEDGQLHKTEQTLIGAA